MIKLYVLSEEQLNERDQRVMNYAIDRAYHLSSFTESEIKLAEAIADCRKSEVIKVEASPGDIIYVPGN